MKKLLFLFTIPLLALISCTNGDEPVPGPIGDTTLYMAANGLTGIPEAIYDLDGNTVYQCELGDHIKSLVAQGSDWYAVILKEDGATHVVKNGETTYMTGATIWCLAVEDGSIYTVQENRVNNTTWVCKDFARIHEVIGAVLHNSFSVDHGNVAMAVFYEPDYWYNGEFIPIEGFEGRIENVYGIDKKGDDLLITYQDINTRKYMYWWKGTCGEFSIGFRPSMSQIVNGHAFILGQKLTSESPAGVQGYPVVVIDGVETALSNDNRGYSAVGLASHDMDTYILVNNPSGYYSTVYKNMQPITLPDVKTPYSVGPYGSGANQNGKSNLSTLGINAIAVVER